MEIKIISVSKVKQDFVLAGEAEYLPRLKKWVKFETIELGAQALDSVPADKARASEAKAVLDRLKEGDYLIVLDERGKQFNTEGFAKILKDRLQSGKNSLVFAIGGAYGWDSAVRERADQVISLSSLTFPFQLTRLILTEQIYRAFTILNNIPYHK